MMLCWNTKSNKRYCIKFLSPSDKHITPAAPENHNVFVDHNTEAIAAHSLGKTVPAMCDVGSSFWGKQRSAPTKGGVVAPIQLTALTSTGPISTPSLRIQG